MALIKLVANYEVEPCIGCKLCDIVCPSGAIRMEARKPIIDDALCIVCGRCVDRCPEDIMWMKSREEALTVTVRPDEVPQDQVQALLDMAGITASISVCVYTLTSSGRSARPARGKVRRTRRAGDRRCPHGAGTGRGSGVRRRAGYRARPFPPFRNRMNMAIERADLLGSWALQRTYETVDAAGHDRQG